MQKEQENVQEGRDKVKKPNKGCRPCAAGRNFYASEISQGLSQLLEIQSTSSLAVLSPPTGCSRSCGCLHLRLLDAGTSCRVERLGA